MKGFARSLPSLVASAVRVFPTPGEPAKFLSKHTRSDNYRHTVQCKDQASALARYKVIEFCRLLGMGFYQCLDDLLLARINVQTIEGL